MTDHNPDKRPQVDSILVIDDDDNWCFISKRLLTKAKASKEILTAKNGLRALELLKNMAERGQKMPDIILLDIKMPVMDGFEFLRTVAATPSLDLSQAKIYICSSSLHPKDRELASGFGVEAYLLKPLTEEMINEILQ